ncbi:MAG: thioesterase family protein [Novosphingobium sp.]|nr:acyl-CoA thioesterase [Novosphingobium sp.]
MQSNSQAGRIDRARFDSARFPFLMEMPVRFEDLDMLGHVNNAAAVAMLQEARVAFHRELELSHFGQGGPRTVVVNMNVEFGAELTYPGVAEIATGILGIGRTSYTFGQLIRQNGQGAVYARVTMVATGETGAIQIPDAVRADFEERCLIGW